MRLYGVQVDHPFARMFPFADDQVAKVSFVLLIIKDRDAALLHKREHASKNLVGLLRLDHARLRGDHAMPLAFAMKSDHGLAVLDAKREDHLIPEIER